MNPGQPSIVPATNAGRSDDTRLDQPNRLADKNIGVRPRRTPLKPVETSMRIRPQPTQTINTAADARLHFITRQPVSSYREARRIKHIQRSPLLRCHLSLTGSAITIRLTRYSPGRFLFWGTHGTRKNGRKDTEEFDGEMPGRPRPMRHTNHGRSRRQICLLPEISPIAGS